jgi:hypothetical protein
MGEVKRIRTAFVTAEHTYTSVDVPWVMAVDGGSKLFRYLRSGGVRAFGRTSFEAARSRRQTRFLAMFGIMAAAWFLIWLF